MSRQTTSQSTLKYQRLLDAAIKLFISRGYKTLSVEEISAAAGISKVTLYKHFPSKDELFLHCVRLLTDRHYEQFSQIISRYERSADKINALFQYNLEVRNKYSEAFIRDMMGTVHIWKEIGPYRKEKARKLYSEILEQGVLSGEFHVRHISHTIELLMSFGDVLPVLYPYGNPREEERFLENLYAFITGALTFQPNSGGTRNDF